MGRTRRATAKYPSPTAAKIGMQRSMSLSAPPTITSRMASLCKNDAAHDRRSSGIGNAAFASSPPTRLDSRARIGCADVDNDRVPREAAPVSPRRHVLPRDHRIVVRQHADGGIGIACCIDERSSRTSALLRQQSSSQCLRRRSYSSRQSLWQRIVPAIGMPILPSPMDAMVGSAVMPCSSSPLAADRCRGFCPDRACGASPFFDEDVGLVLKIGAKARLEGSPRRRAWRAYA